MKFISLVVVAYLSMASAAFSQEPSPPLPASPLATPAAESAPPLELKTPTIAPGSDAATATRAWLATVPADKKLKSDAYFEGGYWLILWNFLFSAAISLFLLNTRLSARIRDFVESKTRLRFLQVALYAVVYLIVTWLLELPLNIYEHYFREHTYGLATQTFGPWFSEQLTAFVVSAVAFVILMMVLYAVFRRAPNTWWLWGTAVVICFAMIGALVGPVFIEPLFNKYKPLEDARISEPILAMARANQIPVKQVFEVDASRQSNRVSANVAGFLGTTRIALNDNLLKQCTLPEIRYVMSHEMGHYVLNHITKFLVIFTLIVFVAFAVMKSVYAACLRRWGNSWGVRGIADPAGLPLLALILACFSFLTTPLTNTITRTQEIEADAFGINTSREADGMAAVALKLGTYRKLDPTPLEEFVFFDHPSGRARIRMAMDWKNAHLPAGG